MNDHAPYAPRLPGGADSTMRDTAPPISPPAEMPCTTRQRVSRIGARAPTAACVGSTPIAAVASAIMVMISSRTGLRPQRSVSGPKTAAPSGRRKNASAKTRNVARTLAVELTEGKKIGAMIGAM